MKKHIFSPIVITIFLAILAVSALLILKPQEEKIIQKVANKSTRLQQIIAKNKDKNIVTADLSLLTAERIYTEEEIKNTTEIQFDEMIKDVELKLPKISEIKEIPAGALHHTPQLIMEAGRNLGAIKEVIKYHPEFEKKTIALYSNCANSADKPNPVRALCLTNLIEIAKKNHLTIDLKKFPAEIVSLSKLVTDI